MASSGMPRSFGFTARTRSSPTPRAMAPAWQQSKTTRTDAFLPRSWFSQPRISSPEMAPGSRSPSHGFMSRGRNSSSLALPSCSRVGWSMGAVVPCPEKRTTTWVSASALSIRPRKPATMLSREAPRAGSSGQPTELGYVRLREPEPVPEQCGEARHVIGRAVQLGDLRRVLICGAADEQGVLLLRGVRRIGDRPSRAPAPRDRANRRAAAAAGRRPSGKSDMRRLGVRSSWGRYDDLL